MLYVDLINGFNGMVNKLREKNVYSQCHSSWYYLSANGLDGEYQVEFCLDQLTVKTTCHLAVAEQKMCANWETTDQFPFNSPLSAANVFLHTVSLLT